MAVKTSWAAGDVLTAADLTDTFAAKAAAKAQACRLYRGSTQSIPNGTLTECLWDNESYDTNNLHSTSSATGRIKVPTGGAGIWYVHAQIQWTANTTGVRELYLYSSTQGVIGYFTTGMFTITGASAYVPVSASVNAADGEEFYISVYQNSGGALTITGATSYTWLAAHRIGAAS